MTSIADLQQRIMECEGAVADYEQHTNLEATDPRGWLKELERQLTVARMMEWRRQRAETVAKMAEISGGM